MWLILTPIFLLLAFVGSYRLRRGVTFHGNSDSAHGGYRWQVPTNKGRVLGLNVGIEAPEGFEFTLREERWFDRLAKMLGVAAEFQVEEKDFDRLLYLLSDDPAFLRTLTAGAVRGQIWDLLSLAKRHGYRFGRLRAKRGVLWVELGLGTGKGEAAPEAATALVTWLRDFRRLLEQTPTLIALQDRDPSLRRGAVLGSLAMALALAGMIQCIGIALTSEVWVLDEERLIAAAFKGGGLLLGSLLLVAFVLVGRSARRHLVLLEVFFLGGFGTVATTGGLLHNANITLDTAPAVVRETTVVSKEIRRGSKGRRSYHLELADWTGEGETRSFEVGERAYGGFLENTRVRLDEHAGALGLRWVEKVRRVN